MAVAVLAWMYFGQLLDIAGCGPPQAAHFGWSRLSQSVCLCSPAQMLHRCFFLQNFATWAKDKQQKQRVGGGLYTWTLNVKKPMYNRVGAIVPGIKSIKTARVGTLTLFWILKILATLRTGRCCSWRQARISSSDRVDGTPLITLCTYLDR